MSSSIWACWGFTGIGWGHITVNLLMVIYIINHEPYFYFIHHWILWSFYDHYTSTGSKTFLWRLIYCMGQHFCQIFLLNSETGRLRMLFGHLSQDEWRQTQIFISSLYIKKIHWVDSSLLFVCWIVLMSPRTKECLWEIAANSAAVFSSVT